ncbi:MAG TPA: hypothetical protein DCQ98_21225 [Planctomycetaceae bacterium]|nr:hypothetical protein [Planctomycetaceae bacterium]
MTSLQDEGTSRQERAQRARPDIVERREPPNCGEYRAAAKGTSVARRSDSAELSLRATPE